jgi:hypothetical protein
MTNNSRVASSRSDALTARVGGLSLVIGAVAFLGVFSFLAARFNYPDVLDGRAADVLPALLATGQPGRVVWAFYSLLPLVWIPAAVGTFHSLRATSEGSMRTGIVFAAIASLAMMLGLMRWPSFHWELARAWAAEPAARPALEVLFNGLNLYLGNYIGEFLGELCMNLFFLLSALAMLVRHSGYPRWVGWLGVATASAGMVGMFRNAASATAPVAEINNYLLPLWMIVFGVALFRHGSRQPSPVPVPVPAAA